MTDGSTCVTHQRNPHRLVVVDAERGIVRKKWFEGSMDPSAVEELARKIDIVDPGRVIDHGTEEDGCFIDLRYVPGITVEEYYKQNINSNRHSALDMKIQATKFWINDSKRTFPYAHMDWTFNNTIVTPSGAFHLVDWDHIQICDLPTLKKHILKRLRETFVSYRDDDHPLVASSLELASNYFEYTFAERP